MSDPLAHRNSLSRLWNDTGAVRPPETGFFRRFLLPSDDLSSAGFCPLVFFFRQSYPTPEKNPEPPSDRHHNSFIFRMDLPNFS